jgi:hypothetical protein
MELAGAPVSVTYTRANTCSVYRKTVDQIADMLSNIASPAAAPNLRRSNSLLREKTVVTRDVFASLNW